MRISSKNLSSVVIKRAIQKGQESRCRWITLSHKKPSAVSLPQHNNSINRSVNKSRSCWVIYIAGSFHVKSTSNLQSTCTAACKVLKNKTEKEGQPELTGINGGK